MSVGVNAEAGNIQQVVLRAGRYFVNIDGSTFSQPQIVLPADNPKRRVQPAYPAKGVHNQDAGVVAIGDSIAVHRRSVYVPAIHFVLQCSSEFPRQVECLRAPIQEQVDIAALIGSSQQVVQPP